MKAEKFSNLPWPYGWRSSAGWSETRTERKVMTAATRSRPEWRASERTPKLPVRRTRKVFRHTSRSAEPTLRRAARFFSWMSSCSRWEKGMPQDYLKSMELAGFTCGVSTYEPVTRCEPCTCIEGRKRLRSFANNGGIPMRKTLMLTLLAAVSASGLCAQTGGAGVWDTLAAPAMDLNKAAVVENVQIVRDRVKITLVSGTIQFTQPANGVVFGAVFHGDGRLQAEPPNPIEAQQLRLFIKEDTLDMRFSEATFSFTDGLLEEVGKQVKWKDGGAGDDLYAKRQEEREDFGGEYLPRLFKSVMSPDRKRTAYFLADLKTNVKSWVEVRYDAMQPEEIRIGRWGEMGANKHMDYWLNFPIEGRDARHVYDNLVERQDYLIPDYQIDATAEEGAEMSATARVTVQPRYSGERVLLFDLDS